MSTTHQSAFKGSERFPISELARIINQVVLRLGVKKRGRFNKKKKKEKEKRGRKEERKKKRTKERRKREKKKEKKGRRREKKRERRREGLRRRSISREGGSKKRERER